MSRIDSTTGLPLLVKQPDENRLYNIPFSQELRSSDTISSVTSVTAAAQGDVTQVTALTIAEAPAHDDDTVQPRISGGTDGERYKIEAIVATAGGDTLEVDVMLKVED